MNNQQLTPQQSRNDIKKNLSNLIQYEFDPDPLLNDFEQCLKIYRQTDKPSDEITKKTQAAITKATPLIGLEKHLPSISSVSEEFRLTIAELANQIIEEYQCNTSSEKALVEIIVIAFGKIIQYSKLLQANIGHSNPICHERNGLYSFLGKEIDRSYRQYDLALSLLRQIKAPSLNVNIKTKNTFISQNQEFTNNQ